MRAGDLVARFGGHPVGELGIDLEASEGPGRWLVTACLYGKRAKNATTDCSKSTPGSPNPPDRGANRIGRSRVFGNVR
jgi:hypothetical protein